MVSSSGLQMVGFLQALYSVALVHKAMLNDSSTWLDYRSFSVRLGSQACDAPAFFVLFLMTLACADSHKAASN